MSALGIEGEEEEEEEDDEVVGGGDGVVQATENVLVEKFKGL
jgi:hypothetical protein